VGLGDSWGTREELLHPRDKNGRFRSKWKMAAGVVDAITNILAKFSPRMFSSDQQAAQYVFNRKPRGGGGLDMPRFAADFPAANQALRRGDMDASTKKFVQMMDRNKVTLPDDIIVSRRVTPEAFGLTPETMGLDEGGIEDFTGKLIADRGYGSTNIGTPLGQNTGILMTVAVPKGTQAIIPGDGPGDREVVLDRDQEYRITKVTPDGAGGYYVMAVATDRTPGETPEPIGRPAPGAGPSVEQREAGVAQVTQSQQGQMRIQSDAQVDAEAAQREQARQQAMPQGAGQQQVAAPPGTPPPRTEPVVSRAIGGTAPGVAPAPAVGQESVPTPPEAAPPTPRIVDIRNAVREANIPAPSAGSRRKEFNDAYEGIASGKKDPRDSVRELERDIAVNQRQLQAGQGDEELADDIRAQEQLRDLIREQYNLPAAAPEVAPAPAKAVKKAAPRAPRTARETPVTPAKVMSAPPAKKAAAPAPEGRVTLVQAKRMSATEMLKRPDVAITGEGDAGYKNVLRNLESGEITPAAARKQLRDSAKYWRDQARKAHDNGRATPERRQQLADEKLAIADKYDRAVDKLIESESVGNTDKFRNAPAKKVAAPAKKATPAKTAPESGDDLDKMTKAELVAEARKLGGITGLSSKTKDQLKAEIRRHRDIGPAEPGSRVGKDQRIAELFDGKKPTVADLRAFAKENDIAPATSLNKMRRDGLIDTILEEMSTRGRRTEGAKPRTPEAPPAKKAAKAAVPGAAPGTAAGKITASRLQPGMRVRLTPQNRPTNQRTGGNVVTIISVDRDTNGRIRISGTDEQGNAVEDISQSARGVSGLSPSQTLVVVPDDVPELSGSDLEERARQRQAKIDDVRRYSDLASELEGLVHDGASSNALARRLENSAGARGLGNEMRPLKEALELGDVEQARNLMSRRLHAVGVAPVGVSGNKVLFDPAKHQSIGSFRVGEEVEIVRPGYKARLNGDEEVELARPLVQGVDDEPDPAIPGPRTVAPIDNTPRKKEFRQAWGDADIKMRDGAPKRATDEIIDDISSGNITPQEGIRRLESEISFNTEELADIDATLRGDLDPSDATRLRVQAAKLEGSIKAQKRASEFLRGYFKDEQVTPDEVIKVETSPEVKEALEGATPEQLKEAAVRAGLPEPQGTTKAEIFTDMVKIIAKQELDARTAKKAAKKAVKKAAPPPPKIDTGKEGVNVRIIGEGLNLDENQDWTKSILDDAQRALNGEGVAELPKNSTPAAVGRWMEKRASTYRGSGAIRYGGYHGNRNAFGDREDKEFLKEREQKLQAIYAEADRMQALADRLKVTRRPSKKAAAPAAKAGPPPPRQVQVEQELSKIKQKMLDDTMAKLQGAKSRRQAEDAMAGLLMPELRTLATQHGVSGRRKADIISQIADRYTPAAPAAKTPAARPTGLGPSAKQVESKSLPSGHTMWLRDANSPKPTYRIYDGDGKLVGVVSATDVEVDEERTDRVAGDTDRMWKSGVPGRPDLSGLPMRSLDEAVADAVDQAKKAASTSMRAKVQRVADVKKVSGQKSDKPLLPNSWGDHPSEIHFHEDGEIGQLLRRLGDGVQLDIDDEPLGNVIGKLATDAVMGRISMDGLLRRLRQLQDRLPDSVAKNLERTIKDLDSPPREVPRVPSETPEPLRRMLVDLANNPLARGGSRADRRGGDDSELDRAVKFIEDFHAGKVGGPGLRDDLQRRLYNERHESMEGKMEIDRIIDRAIKDLDDIWNDPNRRDQLMRRKPQ